jgi:hypothetical protein
MQPSFPFMFIFFLYEGVVQHVFVSSYFCIANGKLIVTCNDNLLERSILSCRPGYT